MNKEKIKTKNEKRTGKTAATALLLSLVFLYPLAGQEKGYDEDYANHEVRLRQKVKIVPGNQKKLPKAWFFSYFAIYSFLYTSKEVGS